MYRPSIMFYNVFRIKIRCQLTFMMHSLLVSTNTRTVETTGASHYFSFVTGKIFTCIFLSRFITISKKPSRSAVWLTTRAQHCGHGFHCETGAGKDALSRTKFYFVLIDLKKAFDTANIESPWTDLGLYGCPRNLQS